MNNVTHILVNVHYLILEDVKDLHLIAVIINKRNNVIRRAQIKNVSGMIQLKHVLISLVIKLNNLLPIVLITHALV